MAQTTFSGPLVSGDKDAGISGGPNTGYVVLSQSVLINYDATLVQTGTVYLPANSRLLEVIVDVITAFNSATSATLTVGSAAAGTQYSTSTNVKTQTARSYSTPTNAQGAAMNDIGTNTAVYATVTSVGQPTAGSVRVTYTYVQTAGA